MELPLQKQRNFIHTGLFFFLYIFEYIPAKQIREYDNGTDIGTAKKNIPREQKGSRILAIHAYDTNTQDN